MEASEIEFLAENKTVTIIPNFSEGRISLIQVRQQDTVAQKLCISLLFSIL